MSAPGCHEDRDATFRVEIHARRPFRNSDSVWSTGESRTGGDPEPGAGVGAAGDEQCNRVDHKREACLVYQV